MKKPRKINKIKAVDHLSLSFANFFQNSQKTFKLMSTLYAKSNLIYIFVIAASEKAIKYQRAIP